MSDTGWVAKTRTGTEYLYEPDSSGILRVSEREGAIFYRNPTMRMFATGEGPGGKIDWDWLRSLDIVERPEVGKHLYIDTFGDAGWVISTEIVSVEDLPDAVS